MHTDTDVATLLQIRITSEGGFTNGEGLPINETLQVEIAVGLNDDPEGSYTIDGPRGYTDPVSSIEVKDDHISFRLRGPLGEFRTCELQSEKRSPGESGSLWSGRLWGDYFDPLTGDIMKMSAKCSAHVLQKQGTIQTKEIHLAGIVSHNDAMELALRTGLPVNAILQAYRINHPGDKDLLEMIRLGTENAGTLMRTALLGGKGPLIGEAATLDICDRALNGLGSRTVYEITEEK